MARPIRQLDISPTQTQELKGFIARPTTPQRMVKRAQIVLYRAEGKSQTETATKLDISRVSVAQWESRFRAHGIEGLNEARRSGRKPTLEPKLREEIITQATRPPPPRKRWTLRGMAKAKGVSPSTVHALWKANDIKPHLVRTFKLSRDPAFEQKFWDVIGLYLAPPDRAVVLCCDEKSQCQALERTQPGLPLGVGEIRTKTHDYTRHGTITLFAALDYLAGKIFRQVASGHTHVEWLRFLKHVDREAPAGLTLHLIIDNYATHKHPKVKEWIRWRNRRHVKQHGCDRITLHFTPTSSSWMNLVERFFRDLTEDVIKDGSFTHVKELVADIESYLQERDLEPKRYIWKAEGAAILAKIQRARESLESACNA